MSDIEHPQQPEPQDAEHEENTGEATDSTAPGPGAEDTTEQAAAEPEGPVEIDPQHLRLLEAVLFSAPSPLSEAAIAERLPDGAPVTALLAELGKAYEGRGVTLARAGGCWFFRTAEDLAEQLRVHMQVPKRLSRAAMETLAIVAYHQPITRAEIEEIRGVGLSKGTLDALMEQGWIGPRGRRRTAGRPVTWGTTQQFLTTFGLASIGDLPGVDDLKAAGLLDKRPAIQITDVQNGGGEEEDEEPLEDDDALLDMDRPEEDEEQAPGSAPAAAADVDEAPEEPREEGQEEPDRPAS